MKRPNRREDRLDRQKVIRSLQKTGTSKELLQARAETQEFLCRLQECYPDRDKIRALLRQREGRAA